MAYLAWKTLENEISEVRIQVVPTPHVPTVSRLAELKTLLKSTSISTKLKPIEKSSMQRVKTSS